MGGEVKRIFNLKTKTKQFTVLLLLLLLLFHLLYLNYRIVQLRDIVSSCRILHV